MKFPLIAAICQKEFCISEISFYQVDIDEIMFENAIGKRVDESR